MRREHVVEVAAGVSLWVEETGDAQAPPLLLVMGAAASGLAWPDALVDALAVRHRVIRYDHRDTGRSTWSFEEEPYAVADLAGDALAVLDALGVERAHLVGMSMGGLLVQLLMADHPERVATAVLLGTGALSSTPYVRPDGTRTPPGELPHMDARVMEMWAQRGSEQLDMEAELAWRVAHWQLIGGDEIPFGEAEARALELRIIEHTGHHRAGTAHAQADPSGLDRTEALARNEVPTLVLESPADIVWPPVHAHHTAQVIGAARLVRIPGMGHALPAPVVAPLAAAVLEHTAAHDGPAGTGD
ncbi:MULTISPECIES: alpha/beta fold hydrolase [unclassified Streptomyces]|uniref:alpha/beta fold hydrolase n=1 Tax=unclassified Streptomyces TaxID=2593676 RepID=UPI0008DD49E8|nr:MULTISPECIES: alpha/beta hydrolase [unclassified Streptomyces]OII70698.1 alpha/beta hydrolase [Streptomyces sp. CC77]